jgi:NAD(P)-dependent dehydrogenase (short-subunit alcohol dehydrogenase family)
VRALREGFEEKFFLHWRVAQAALPTLSAHGSLTFIDAISARAAIPETVGLAAINGALDAMIKPLARELKPRRVNAVAPGLIETHCWDSIPEPQRKKVFAATAAATLVGRNGHAEEVAQAIAFLVTNNYVSGTTIEIDGGLHVA